MKKAILALLLLFPFIVFSQNIKKALKNANSFYDQKLYYDAIPAYLEVLKIDANSAEANFKLGVSYLNTIHKTKAYPYLEKAAKINPTIDPSLNYRLGEAYHFNHKYEEAL